MFKTAIATAILGLGILGAYFVIQNPAVNTEISQKTDTANLPKNSPFVENLNANLVTNKTSDSAETSPLIPGNNLTDNFINGLKQDIAQNNLNNTSGNLVVSDPNQITGELLNDAVKKFSSERLKSVVDESRIKISQDNGKQVLLKYIQNFQNIIIKSTAEIPASALSGNPTPETIRPLVEIYSKIIEEYYQLPVPPSALSIHKKQIELMSRKKRVLEEISNYKTDPVSAILASDELEKIDHEFYGYHAIFTKFVESI